MHSSMIAYLSVGVLVLFSLCPQSQADAADWIGQQVMPKDGCDPKVGQEPQDFGDLDLPWTVEKVNGDWLWIGNGWVKADAIVGVKDADTYYRSLLDSGGVTKYARYFIVHLLARVHRFNGNRDLETVVFTEAIKSLQDQPPEELVHLLSGLARAYLADEKPARALDTYSMVLQLKTDDAHAFHGVGHCFESLHDVDSALAAFGEAIRLAPEEAHHRICRAKYLSTQSRFEESIAEATSALVFEPDSAEAWCARADALYRSGAFAKAIEDYKKSLKVKSIPIEVYCSASLFFASCPDEVFRDGAMAVELALKANKSKTAMDDHDQVYCALAAAYAETGDFERAVAWQKKVCELKPTEENQGILADYELGRPYRNYATEPIAHTLGLPTRTSFPSEELTFPWEQDPLPEVEEYLSTHKQ